ncbi:MAG: VWA domain-containing protein [Woeseiaceae bacterium]
MPAEFHFLRPDWLYALPLVLAAAILLARRRLGPGRWLNVVDPSLAPYVLSRATARGGNTRFWLLGLGGVLAVLALAGPAWQRVDTPVFRSDQALVIALDLSRSMDAQDVAPSRLARARLKILDLLKHRGDGQTALVVYSANAFTVTPLTTDVDTIAALVNSLSTDIMPSRGSYPVVAIHKGRQLLEQAGAAVGEVLLITDGGATAAAERAARDLRDSGYTLSVLAVGTEQGAPIPRLGGGFVTDRSGNIAVPRLEAHSLQKLAVAGAGRFARLAPDDSDLETLLSGEAGGRRTASDKLGTDQWREEGPWLVLLLLPLAALAFRRGWLMLIVFAVLPFPHTARASAWDDLWLTRDQQGQRQLRDGAAADAAETFQNPDWRAVAQYRADDFAASEKAFSKNDDSRSLYNLGNALARQGKFDAAIGAYDKALKIDPDDADAAYNRDLLKKLKDQQQKSDQQKNGKQPSQDRQQGGKSSQSGEQSGEQQQSDAQSGSGSEDKEGSQQQNDDQQKSSEEDMKAVQQELQKAADQAKQQQKTDESPPSEAELEAQRHEQEQQQALEQWLRRIPNDPGGLLRRKFRSQYQQLGKDQDGNNTWPDDEAQPW